MSGAADRLRALTAAVEARDAAPPEQPTAAAARERTAAFRVGCDLPPDDYHQWQKQLLDTAIATGRGKLTQQEAIYWLIKALDDEHVARRWRALIIGGKAAPTVQHKRGGAGEAQ